MDYFDILLAKKLNGGGGGGDITVESLSVSENGTYTAPSGKAYSPVNVEVPLPSNALFKQTLSNLPSPIATFTGADAPLDSLKASIVGVQSGSGDPSPSNVRPISGWSSANVTRTGKNLANVQNTNTAPSINTGENVPYNSWTTDYIKVDTNVSYTLSTQQNVTRYILFYANDKTYLGYMGAFPSVGVGLNTYTRWSEVGYIRLRFDAETTAQLEVGTSATTYEPYNNNTYTIPFKDPSDNPIMVYGGGIDISGGSGQNDCGMVVYDGSENWIYHSSNRWFLASLPTNLNVDLKAQSISNMRIYQDIAGSVGNYFTFGSTGIYCNKTTADQTLADFKVELSTNNMQIKYPLQTPEAIQTQPTQVRTISGNNNVFVDCGEVTDLKFFSETP